MGVHLRKKKISGGKHSLYLDFFPPIRLENGKFTRREFIGRYLYSKPKNEEEKRMNKENLHFADTLRLKREKEILNEQDGIYNNVNKKVDFIEYFKKLAEKRKESEGNYGNWLSVVHYLNDFTGGKCKMADLKEDFCNDFKEYLLKAKRLNTVKGLKLSHNSAVSYFNKFRAAINAAFDARLLNENPLKHVKGIPEKESKREFLTQEELQKLAKTDCDLETLKRACLFSALSGLRWSDITTLRWKDIQKTNGDYFIHIIQKKTQDPFINSINDTAVELLGKKGKPDDLIFDGLKYSDSNNDKIKRWVLKAGIDKKITLHNFRHTYATILLNKGVDFFTVSKMLGHRHIKTTMIYSKVLSETKTKASKLIDIEL
jgi:integrase